MGPRPFSRGDAAFEVKTVETRKTLQWGHGLSAVETEPIPVQPDRINSLQWGHGLSAVETISGWFTVPEGGLLQWGHGLSAVETAH